MDKRNWEVKIKDFWYDIKYPLRCFFEAIARLCTAILLLVFMIVAILSFREDSCKSYTKDMGYPYRISGLTCQIEVEPGKWIPIDAYRYEVR